MGHDDLFDSKVLYADTGADNVRDGIQSPHLMKMHIRRRHAMDLPLRDGDSLEDGESAFLYKVGERAFLDEFFDVGV